VNRRDFLRRFGTAAFAAAAAAHGVADLDAFLWEPTKTILIPDAPKLHFAKDAFQEAAKGLGVSMRMVKQYDVKADVFPVRLDIMYGWSVINPAYAVRIDSVEEGDGGFVTGDFMRRFEPAIVEPTVGEILAVEDARC
jgi:hypothetical protein